MADIIRHDGSMLFIMFERLFFVLQVVHDSDLPFFLHGRL